MEENLRDILDSGKDWESVKTTTPGVFIKKIPASKRKSACIAIEVNPPNKSGNPSKWKGLLIRNSMELRKFREILALNKLDEIVEVIERICPGVAEEERVLDI
jgi:hypothetical protein